ncbi:ABC transporter substrate-binding protein [Oleiharenicola sp. Vm1]|uniref:ABC transporter substrate-binding protein n=1 Tax=Oleiharenicola sp. Vm1 TaxID=3398393 RepID=UPI0039F5B52A
MSFRRCLLSVLYMVAAVALSAVTLRVGYFPNITHAQGVIGAQTTREGHGWFEQRLGPDVTIQWFPFNAGPSAMEAIFAGSIDLAYVGPNPALNAYIKSRGAEVRVLAGAAAGGAALVVPADGRLRSAADFRGKRLATPQLGNTQDVAARVWLKRHGYRVTLTGGDVPVIPTPNADQLALFEQGKVDAVWTVEPWVSRLELEAGGRVLLEQNEAVTTVLVASAGFLRTQPDLAQRFVAAHGELTACVNQQPAEARAKVRAGLSAVMRREMSAALIEHAWPRLRFTVAVTREQFEGLVREAQSVGFLRDAVPLDQMFSGKP